LVERIEPEALRLSCPSFADELVGREALQGLVPAGPRRLQFGAEPAFAFESVDPCGVVIGLAWDVIYPFARIGADVDFNAAALLHDEFLPFLNLHQE
jgi:hypothetical protein